MQRSSTQRGLRSSRNLLSAGYLNTRSGPLVKDVNWKTCHYSSNSGISNATKTDARLPSQQAAGYKRYNVNSESGSGWVPEKTRGSMINFQRGSYDPVTHVVSTRAPYVSAHRQKGLSEFYDRANIYTTPVNTEFNATLSTNPTSFHRKVGEFTSFHDSCRRHTNHAPFVRRF